MKTQNPISVGNAGSQNVAGYVGEITFFADSILRKNHVWADGAPIDAAQWPELAAYAATAGWQQNDAGQYLTPDLRGRFLLGADEEHAIMSAGGQKTHTITKSELPRTQILTNNIYSGKTGNLSGGYIEYINTASGSKYATEFLGDSQAFSLMPPYYTATPQIRAKVDKIIATVTCPWEVGDILHTKNTKHPSERWPGTEWAPIETFLLGASENHKVGGEGGTGGEEYHTLTIDEIPSHTHNSLLSLVVRSDYNTTGSTNGLRLGEPNQLALSATGNSNSHNNMPPYIAVYIWERTA